MQKHSVESFILSKKDHCNIVFNGLLKCQKQRNNKLVQACAGFVKCKYGVLNDIVDLNWLLVEERIDFVIMKLIFNGLHKKNMPKNLQSKVSEGN